MKRLLLALLTASLPLAAASPVLAHTVVRETSIADRASAIGPGAASMFLSSDSASGEVCSSWKRCRSAPA